MNELVPIAVTDPNTPGLPPGKLPRPKPANPPVTREAVTADDDVLVPYTATSVPCFSEDSPVMPLPENVVELVTVTVVVVPVRVVTVKVDADTAATVPLTFGVVKPDGRVPAAWPDPLGTVELGAVAAGMTSTRDSRSRGPLRRRRRQRAPPRSTMSSGDFASRLAVSPHSSDLSFPLLRRPCIGPHVSQRFL